MNIHEVWMWSEKISKYWLWTIQTFQFHIRRFIRILFWQKFACHLHKNWIERGATVGSFQDVNCGKLQVWRWTGPIWWSNGLRVCWGPLPEQQHPPEEAPNRSVDTCTAPYMDLVDCLHKGQTHNYFRTKFGAAASSCSTENSLKQTNGFRQWEDSWAGHVLIAVKSTLNVRRWQNLENLN